MKCQGILFLLERGKPEDIFIVLCLKELQGTEGSHIFIHIKTSKMGNIFRYIVLAKTPLVNNFVVHSLPERVLISFNRFSR